jgi:hypothetical protein
VRRRPAQLTAALVLGCLLLGGCGSSSQNGSASPISNDSSPASDSTTQTNSYADLALRVKELEDERTWIIAPMAALIAVLTIGGALSVVFSLRDQRRVSQLHELTIASETSSQRRTEQTYASFLEQSQTTLALVNDTLRLAKNASDREASTLHEKSSARIATLEERARRLMNTAFTRDEFDLVLKDRAHRHELQAIGEAVRDLERQSLAQDLAIPPYTRFVKAIYQFLRDETEDAIDSLQRDSQITLPGDLHRFSLYWLGYMLTTIGEYDAAQRWLIDDKLGLPTGDAERFQLDRLILETQFFALARPKAKRQGEEIVSDSRSPRERLRDARQVLDALGELVETVTRDVTADRGPVRDDLLNDIARTRADIFAWVAYDPKRVDTPLTSTPKGEAARVEADDILSEHPLAKYQPAPLDRNRPSPTLALAAFEQDQTTWDRLLADDVCRAWALRLAFEVCAADEKPDFEVQFAMAECSFMLGETDSAETAFRLAEESHTTESEQFRETRERASLQQSSLIYHSRLLYLHQGEESTRINEERQVRAAFGRTREVIEEIPEGRSTIFSQLQRRNLTRQEFMDENRRILVQEDIKVDDGTTPAT